MAYFQSITGPRPIVVDFGWVCEAVLSSTTPDENDFLVLDNEGTICQPIETDRNGRDATHRSRLQNQSSFNTLSCTESNLELTTTVNNRTVERTSIAIDQGTLFEGKKFYLLEKDARAELAGLIARQRGQVVDHINKTEYAISNRKFLDKMPIGTEHVKLRSVEWLRHCIEEKTILEGTRDYKARDIFELLKNSLVN